jgi:hypothetical protein
VEPARPSDQLVVPLASAKYSLESLNEEPLHHLPVVVFSIATETPVIVAPEPDLDEAVPVTFPVQVVAL